ncbi:hypothetical protein GOBAR_DD31570 [Gossypium barbadense]|nr:hypothetical protein GOBAR_DD31570 [Gossypium barbadense]
MGKKRSLKSKAVHFVTDLTTGLLNPISDKSSKPPETLSEPKISQVESINKEDDRGDLVDGPDTSSFTAFLYSLLSSSESGHNVNLREPGDGSDTKRKRIKWLLLYRCNFIAFPINGLMPFIFLQVVGDRKGVFLISSLLKLNLHFEQGTNNTFVFTNGPGGPVVYRPTGANRYFTLCSTEFLAIGGGGHFALYLDGELLNGSSSFSETYRNPCLASSKDFEVKEVEEILASSRIEMPGICRW